MKRMDVDTKAMEVILLQPKNGRGKYLKLFTNIKEDVKNTLCVAEKIEDELLATNQETELCRRYLRSL